MYYIFFFYIEFNYGLSADNNLGLINYRGEPHTKKEIVKKNAIDTYNLALIDRNMHRKTRLVNGVPVINVPIYWEVDMDNLMVGSKKATKKNDKRKQRVKTVRSYANGKISQDESSSLSGEEKTLGGYPRKNIQVNKISHDKKHVKTQKDQDNKYQQKSNGKSKRNAVKRIENKAKKNLANKVIHKTSGNNAARMEEKSIDSSSEDSRHSTGKRSLKTDADDESPKKPRNVVDDSDDENVRYGDGTNKKSNNTTLDESPSGERDEDSVGSTNGQHTRRKTNKSSGDSAVHHLRGKAIGNKARAGKITLVVLGQGQKSASDKMVDLAKRSRIVERIRRENPEETKSATYTSDLTKDRVPQPSTNSKNKHTSHGSKDNTLLSQDNPDDDSGNLTVVHYRNHHRG